MDITPEKLRWIYETMYTIRRFEETMLEQTVKGKSMGVAHTSDGEEACPTGICAHLTDEDWIASTHRGHGHCIAKGLEPKRMMAEIFGRVTGQCKGKGGSMHIFDSSKNFAGGYAIVGGQLPIAVGLSLAASFKNENRVVLCFLGDGALNEGEFHEAMNLAALWRLPIIFFCENNLFGMGSPVHETVAAPEIYRIADAYNMPSQRIDGMSILEVNEVFEDVAKRVRNGEGPFFLEAMTYRFRGHSMADPVLYREKTEEEQWKDKDPIPHYKRWLISNGLASEEELDVVNQTIEQVVEDAVQFAENSPIPDLSALHKDIYAEPGA